MPNQVPEPSTVIMNGAVRTMDPSRPSASAVVSSGGRISYVGGDRAALDRAGLGADVIDAGGRVVSPGFIDIHSHTDLGLLADPSRRLFKSYLMQGITTVLTGNCGMSEMATAELLARAETAGLTLNFGALIGHGYLRGACGIPPGQDVPSEAQLRAMTGLTADAMTAGAFGMSSGLEYIPGLSSRTAELIECARVVAGHGGLYATHMRSEGDGLLAALEEAIRIGAETGVRLQVSHIKSDGRCNWWKTGPAIAMIEAARQSGVDVSLDQYPYTAFGWNPSIFIASEELADGQAALAGHMADPARRARIKRGIVDRISRYHGGDGDLVVVFDWTDRTGRRWAGQTLAQILSQRGEEPSAARAAELILEMLPDEQPDQIMGCDISTSDESVAAYLRLPYAVVCTDGFHQPWLSQCHPRTYGAFPRVLGDYVRGKQVISLDQALRKMTAVPAAIMKLADRGMIREGYRADLVVFDPRLIADRATFTHPAPPSGIDFVLVNGVLVVDHRHADADRDGFLAGTIPADRAPGMVLRGPGFRQGTAGVSSQGGEMQ